MSAGNAEGLFTVSMRSPEGETREVEAPSEELARLMNAGWTYVKPAQPEEG